MDALTGRLADLRRKLTARDGQPGLTQNAEDLKTAITALEEEIERRRQGEAT